MSVRAILKLRVAMIIVDARLRLDVEYKDTPVGFKDDLRRLWSVRREKVISPIIDKRLYLTLFDLATTS